METNPGLTREPDTGDAFGAMLMACHEQQAAPWSAVEIIERDDGFITGGDAARYFAEPEVWPPLDRELCERALGRVLDVGSGAGRHALYLQEVGLDVLALDVSPLASEVCRQRGVRRTFTGTVFDLAKQSPERFDTCLMLGNNLGLLESRERAPLMLDALGALAAPNAVILGQGTDPYGSDDPVHLRYHQRNRERGRMGGQVRMRVRYRGLATAWFDYLLASLDELQSLLAGTPWTLNEVQAAEPGYGAVLRRS